MSDESSIEAVCGRINFDKELLEKKELGQIEVDSFELAEFWTQFGGAVQSLSNVVTKIGFNCGQKPFPCRGEVDSMMQSLLQNYTMMRDIFLVLPPEVGTVLYETILSAVIAVMSSLVDFVMSLYNLNEKGAKERLTLTGAFWDACNAVDCLPKDNLEAALKVMENEVLLASDAKEELETTLKEDNDGDYGSWTDSERKLAQNALGLVKVSHVCVRWLKEAVKRAGSSVPTHQLDMVSKSIRTVSPALDDFVSELYHPVDFPKVYEKAGKLVGMLRSLLEAVREGYLASMFSAEHINKIEQFINHNHQKVDPTVFALPQLGSLSIGSTG